jgi:acetyl esterase/lipase
MRKIIYTALLSTTTLFACAQDVKSIPLYPEGIPNSKPTPATYVEMLDKNHFAKMVSNPVLLPYFPEKGKATGTAIVICPGGGYSGLSMENEGTSIAKEFNKIGVTAFILKYRLPSDLIMQDKTIGPLQDAQQAILMVRTHAAEWGVNPAKVGIIGFSAGGHLASTAETHYNTPVITNKANVSLRPDFAILMYPVITFTTPSLHVGSKENLLGKNASQAQIDLYSNEKQVTADTPPTFIVQAEDDKTVPVQNSVLFYSALVEAKVKAEMHLYQAGGHGFGLNNTKSKEHWFEWCATWMNANGF